MQNSMGDVNVRTCRDRTHRFYSCMPSGSVAERSKALV